LQVEKIERADYQIIYNLIPEGSSILDLGCGEGKLIEKLQKKNVLSQGVEIKNEYVKECIRKKINVIQDDIDRGFAHHQDNSFDFVILNRTLQVTKNPVLVAKEAVRVGRKTIVSFPNFAHYSTRFDLLFSGTAPKTKDLPFDWYDTPNIRVLSIKDFRNFCQNNKFLIKKEYFFTEKRLLPHFLLNKIDLDNLFSPYALFVLESQGT